MKIYGDYLCRMQTVTDISTIVKSCIDSKKPTAFSLEGEWGKGKSWIVEKVAASLEGVDLTVEKTQDKRPKSFNEYIVFMYNAWEKDYYEEPLLAILITLINQLNKCLKLENFIKGELRALYELTKNILEDSLRSISKRVLGIDVVDVGKRGYQILQKASESAKVEIAGDYSDNNIEKDINTVVATLNRISKETPIVFIVDELDRCLPEHAIKTLERLHHVFSKVNSSVTIISVNEAQLKTTVQKMFGNDIPFEAYLRKFVDFRISLNSGEADVEEIQAKLEVFLNLFGDDADEQLYNNIIASLCNNMTPRDFEKICNNAMLCHRMVGKDTTKFSKNYALAELLMFACKIAIEKEGGRGAIVPILGNTAKSKLGKYIKEFLRKLPQKLHVELRKHASAETICYICLKGVLEKQELEKQYLILLAMDMAEIDSYYSEYARYYKLIK